MEFRCQNNPEDLYPSHETDLDFLDCFGRGKSPSYRLILNKYGIGLIS